MVVDRENRLQFRSIELLRLEGDRVVFREGLQAGDRVCISPLEIAVEGMEVRMIEAPRGEMSAREGGGW
jgi:membrane fusion protein, multidrug efflux system